MGCNLSIQPCKQQRSFVSSVKLSAPNTIVDTAVTATQTTATIHPAHITENIVIGDYTRDMHHFYSVSSEKALGKGMTGSVRICTHRATGMKYALKTLEKKSLQNLSMLKDEIKIMAELDHPNILRIQEYFETKEHIYIILELCTGGEVFKQLNKKLSNHFSERKTREIVRQILSAVRYCHNHGIVHRDIKLENFLFENTSKNSSIKMIDFGISQRFQPAEVLYLQTGTPHYIAPEVLDQNYTAKCDIWSIGVACYLLLTGRLPFDGQDQTEIFTAVRRGKVDYDPDIFMKYSDAAKDFIMRCLKANPDQRMSAEQAQNHPWVSYSSSTIPKHVISRTVSLQLQKFAQRQYLTRVCREVVAHTLTSNQVKMLRQEFIEMDADHCGEITLKEMKAALAAIDNISTDEVEKIVNKVDFDHSGKIRYHEFLAGAISRRYLTETNLKLAFERMSHRNESITLKDLEQLLGCDYSTDELHEMWSEVMEFEEQTMDYEKFKAIIMEDPSSPPPEPSVDNNGPAASTW